MTAEPHEIRFEIEGIIRLLAQNLYADPDVFLREMIQNAHDAIVKRGVLAAERGEAAPPGLIRIVPDRAAGTLAIEDNGAGLTREEIHRYLATIGGSGTRELRQSLEDRDRRAAIELIGQFGIGILSAFIVASRVEITTSPAGGPALRWISDGGKHYRIEEAARAEVGTTVVLHLRAEHSRYLDAERLRRIVHTYADFIGIPVQLAGDGAPTNAVDAPWHRRYPSDEERRQAHHLYWERRFVDEHSLAILPLDEPVAFADPARAGRRSEGRIRGVLGITDRHVPGVNTRGTVDVYIARMFIVSGSREALPPWARFIQGVVECDVLTPNAARDDVVRNEALAAVRDALGSRILDWLTRLSADDPARFTEIMRWHAYDVLAMAVQEEHEGFFRAVADLVPLESDQGPLTVRDYLATAARLPGSDRRVVHYFTERGSATQYYVLCAAKGIRVFNASEPFAERFLERYARTFPERVDLSRLDVTGSAVIFEPVPEEDRRRDRFRELEAAYAMIFPDLRCIARVSRFKPADLPAVLTESRDQKTRRELEQVSGNMALPGVLRGMIKDLLKDKREPLQLHLNADNATIVKLAERGSMRDEVAQNALVSLYNNALMLLSRTIAPGDVEKMFKQYNHVIELMLSLEDERRKLAGEKAAAEKALNDARSGSESGDKRTKYVTCFVAMPFSEAARPVFEALRAVLEDMPYCWRVTRADTAMHKAMLWENVRAHMAQAHCFIADVSEPNANVMLEIGRMEVLGRPLLLLQREGSPELPADLRGHVVARYSGEGKPLEDGLRTAVENYPDLRRQRGERYLSEALLRRLAPALLPEAIRQLKAPHETWNDFLAADDAHLAERIKVPPSFVEHMKNELARLLERGR